MESIDDAFNGTPPVWEVQREVNAARREYVADIGAAGVGKVMGVLSLSWAAVQGIGHKIYEMMATTSVDNPFEGPGSAVIVAVIGGIAYATGEYFSSARHESKKRLDDSNKKLDYCMYD